MEIKKNKLSNSNQSTQKDLSFDPCCRAPWSSKVCFPLKLCSGPSVKALPFYPCLMWSTKKGKEGTPNTLLPQGLSFLVLLAM